MAGTSAKLVHCLANLELSQVEAMKRKVKLKKLKQQSPTVRLANFRSLGSSLQAKKNRLVSKTESIYRMQCAMRVINISLDIC